MRDDKLRSTLGAGAAGALMALSQIALAGNGNCTLPGEGRCSACGGCLVVLGGLAGWALWRMRRHRQPR